jgi:hypothetical protein
MFRPLPRSEAKLNRKSGDPPEVNDSSGNRLANNRDIGQMGAIKTDQAG